MSLLRETQYASLVEILQERRSFSNSSYNKSISNNAVVNSNNNSNMENDEFIGDNLTQDIIQSLSILNQYSKGKRESSMKCSMKKISINEDKIQPEPNHLQRQYSENFWENYEQYCIHFNVAPIQSIKSCINTDGSVNLALKADKIK